MTNITDPSHQLTAALATAATVLAVQDPTNLLGGGGMLLDELVKYARTQRPTLVSATAVALTAAAHHNRTIILTAGASLSAAWASTLDGFRATIVNQTGADLTMTMSGFTLTTPTNTIGATKIRSNGVVDLLVITPDAGTTKVMRIAGDVEF